MSPIVIAPVTTLVGLGLFERGFPGVIAVSSLIQYCKSPFLSVRELILFSFLSNMLKNCVSLCRLRSVWKLASQPSWSYCSSHRYLNPLYITSALSFTLFQLHQTAQTNFILIFGFYMLGLQDIMKGLTVSFAAHRSTSVIWSVGMMILVFALLFLDAVLEASPHQAHLHVRALPNHMRCCSCLGLCRNSYCCRCLRPCHCTRPNALSHRQSRSCQCCALVSSPFCDIFGWMKN